MAEFRLPDVGEGLTAAEIVSWKVKAGDVVAVNDVVVEIETAKSLVELPVPYAGVVTALLVAEGTTVPVGTPIISVGEPAAAGATDVAAPEVAAAPAGPGGSGAESDRATGPAATLESREGAPATPTPAGPTVPSPAPTEPAREPVLVGYGPRQGAVARRSRHSTAAAPEAAAEAVNATFSTAVPVATPSAPAAGVLAKPPVRKLAKERGVDLRQVTPTGPHGTITRADVEGWGPPSAPTATATAPADGWDGLARLERVAVRSVRKATAEAMVRSAFTAPHVTEWVTVDVTRTMRLVARLRQTRELRDVRLSPMTVLARAMCLAVRRTPEVNARWDDASGEIVLQRYVNLGIATATSRGLIVPNIKDADRLDLPRLAAAVHDVVTIARSGRTTPAGMTGGTMTLTNIGVFGVDAGTPILPPGEAAIMAMGAVAKRPWVHQGRIRARDVTTLALSFDHRFVDGEQGSRFLGDVATLLEHPDQALVWA